MTAVQTGAMEGTILDCVRPGLLLLDRYVVKSLLGQGGMGVVWSGMHIGLMRHVAIKFATRVDIRSHGRFLSEARIIASLSSPHIVDVLDVGVHEALPFFVMELLDGEPLSERILAHQTLSPAETFHVISQVASALDVAHAAGVIHRDLKPENVFCLHREERIKLLDFGVARSFASSGTLSSDFVGTPSYLSPEQACDPRTADARSDLWSLAAITFECLLGQRVFRGQSLPDVIANVCYGAPPIPSTLGAVPPGFDAWFARALARDPTERFQTPGDFCASLREALFGESPSSRWGAP